MDQYGHGAQGCPHFMGSTCRQGAKRDYPFVAQRLLPDVRQLAVKFAQGICHANHEIGH